MPAPVITVVNQKGGVGKSTSAISLGAALARAGHQTLLVDFDPQCNASTGLGSDQTAGEYAFSSVFLDGIPLHRVFVETYIEGLDLIPGDPTLSLAVKSSTQLADALRPYLEQLDFCIIDTPPNLGSLTLAAILAAATSEGGLVLVPIEPSRWAIDGFAKLLTTLDEFSSYVEARGVSLDRFYRILLTRVKQNAKRTRRYVERELADFSQAVCETFIRENEDLKHAASFGQAIFDYKRRSNGAADYASLAKEILTFIQEHRHASRTTTQPSGQARSEQEANGL